MVPGAYCVLIFKILLSDLDSMEALRNHKPTSNDGKFLIPAILDVFIEIKSNLDTFFDTFKSQLLSTYH